MSKPLLPDPRLHAYRADLAADQLRGLVEAERFVKGEPRQVVAASLPLRREPRFDATLDTEALKGETVTLYAEGDGWAWVQIDRDRYVGYMPSDGLSPKIVASTHKIAALRSYVYSEPDSKSPTLDLLSLNALVSACVGEGRFLALDGGGYIVARHTLPVDERADDPVAIAEAFVGTPYLWGGRTSIGIDCSGLVQLAAEAVGLSAPRDADMQAAELGEAGGLARRCRAPPRRSRVLGWPCRDHDEPRAPATRECPSYGRGDRTLRRRQGAHHAGRL